MLPHFTVEYKLPFEYKTGWIFGGWLHPAGNGSFRNIKAKHKKFSMDGD